MRRTVLALLGGLLAALLPAVGSAQPRHRYSGTVDGIDLQRGVVVVDELAEKGRLVRHEVHVEPDTPIVSSRRLKPWEIRGRSAYSGAPVSLVDLLRGDFVIVESLDEDGREAGQQITIVEKPSP